MAKATPPLEAMQVWREVDPRFERYVRIESVGVGVGRRSVSIRTVERSDRQWTDAPRSRVSYCDPERFNGKRGGYEFVSGPNE